MKQNHTYTRSILYGKAMGVLGGYLMLLLVSACFNTKDREDMGNNDFVSAPVQVRLVSQDRDEEDMLASEKIYEMQTCLKDRITLQTLSLGTFLVDGQEYVSDEEGCVVWKHKESFNPYAQSYPIAKEFEITGQGKYAGRLVIPYAINPWHGIRPTSTAEFVERFSHAVDDASSDESSSPELEFASKTPRDSAAFDKKSRLKAATVHKGVFYHKETARAHGAHWNFVITPQLEVFDAEGVSHVFVPQNGTLDVQVQLFSLHKKHDVEQLAAAKEIATYQFKDLAIESGRVEVKAQIPKTGLADDENMLLYFSLLSDSEHAKNALDFLKSKFVVRPELDAETLQEAEVLRMEVATEESTSAEDEASVVGGVDSYFAENPSIKHIRTTDRSTTSVQYKLHFSTKLVHRNTRKAITNQGLTVSLGKQSERVRVSTDGVIHFPFDFRYHYYTMQQVPQELEFVISDSDQEQPFSVKIPLFFKPWSIQGEMTFNPEILDKQDIAAIRKVNVPRPGVFVHSITLSRPTPVEYKIGKDLSIGLRHEYTLSGRAKMRSYAMAEYEHQRLVDAPDGRYRLDVYLSCAFQPLKNWNPYFVEVLPGYEKVRIFSITSEQERKKYKTCPASHTSFDVMVEGGEIEGQLILELDDPRLAWVRSQLTLLLTPYKTGELKDSIFFTKTEDLYTAVEPSPVASDVILNNINKNADPTTVHMIDLRPKTKNRKAAYRGNPYWPCPQKTGASPRRDRVITWEEVCHYTRAWQVAIPYIQYLNNLESSYLEMARLNYVSLENTPYSTIHFKPGVMKNGECVEPQKIDRGNAKLRSCTQPRICRVGTRECLDETSTKRSVPYDAAGRAHLKAAKFTMQESLFQEDGERSPFSREEMRNVVWNRDPALFAELVNEACGLWYQRWIQLISDEDSGLVVPSARHQKLMLKKHLAGITNRFLSFKDVCKDYHSEAFQNSWYDVRNQSVTANYMVKGNVTQVTAHDAGTDILTFKNIASAGVTRALSIYSTVSVNVAEIFFSLLKTVGINVGGVGVGLSYGGEHDYTDQDEIGGGMTHYSNWTVLQLLLQFHKPKYCVALRLNEKFLHKHFEEYTPRRYYGQGQYDLLRAPTGASLKELLLRFLDQATRGYLVCTEQEPPNRGEERLYLETYRFPEPRFINPTVFDVAEEKFRNWPYPIRGQDDYMQFLTGLTVLEDNDVQVITRSVERMYDASTSIGTWIFEDDKVKDHNRKLLPTMKHFVAFPKNFLYDRLASNRTPQFIGGFLSYDALYALP